MSPFVLPRKKHPDDILHCIAFTCYRGSEKNIHWVLIDEQHKNVFLLVLLCLAVVAKTSECIVL